MRDCAIRTGIYITFIGHVAPINSATAGAGCRSQIREKPKSRHRNWGGRLLLVAATRIVIGPEGYDCNC
jgi:hypothetical protein